MSFSIPALPALPQAFENALAKTAHLEQVMLAHLPAFPLADLQALEDALAKERPLPALFAMFEPFREQLSSFLSRVLVAIKFFQALQAAQATPVQ